MPAEAIWPNPTDLNSSFALRSLGCTIALRDVYEHIEHALAPQQYPRSLFTIIF